jgi:hypothetical protein
MRSVLQGCVALVAIAGSPLWVNAAETGQFRVGAARVDITPPPSEYAKPVGGMFEPIYARVIVVDNGRTRAVLASVDAADITEQYPVRLTQVLASGAGIPVQQVMLAQTHAHDGMRIGDMPDPHLPMPFSLSFNARVERALDEGVRQAVRNLQPARIGFGRGQSFLNANRKQWDPTQLRYLDGADRSGLLPTDRSVYVISFETPAGKPLAVYATYSMMPVVHLRNAGGDSPQNLGGDYPAATSLYVEQALGDASVTIVTVGGEDQQPLYAVSGRSAEAVARSETLTRAYGAILGEEILATDHGIGMKQERGPIYGAATSVTCPGKLTTPKYPTAPCADRPNALLAECPYKEVDSDPVTIKMGLLMIGDIAIDGIWEITDSVIIHRIQAVSPYAHTFVVSQFFGPAGYLIHDEDYEITSFNSVNTRIKQGCGEAAAIKGFEEMLPKVP